MDLSFLKDWRPQDVKFVVVENGGTNIEHQENHYDGTKAGGVDAAADTPLVAELLPVFMNVRSEVTAFISSIDGLKPTGVTEKVNELVKDGKISRANRKGVLHGILNRYGLYRPCVETWNKQVN